MYICVFDVYITVRFHQRTAASFALPYVLDRLSMLRIPRTRVYHNRTKKKAQAGLLSEDATWTWDVDVWMKTYVLESVGMLELCRLDLVDFCLELG